MLSQTSNVCLVIVVLLNLCTTARLNAFTKNASNPNNPAESSYHPPNIDNTADAVKKNLSSSVHHARRPDNHKYEEASPPSEPQPAEALPQPERLANPHPPLDPAGSKLPEFPQRPDAVYFIVAVAGGAKVWGRTLARTLIDMGPPFDSPLGPPLRPVYIDIPPNGRWEMPAGCFEPHHNFALTVFII